MAQNNVDGSNIHALKASVEKMKSFTSSSERSSASSSTVAGFTVLSLVVVALIIALGVVVRRKGRMGTNGILQNIVSYQSVQSIDQNINQS